ncbi:hypothetical protein ACC691_36210, partial [Rhizobium johnstonii]|uniref:hypothetical protein n=1 Tax=Rhizobium johnstonii TaxID=3019933 RepID=UPI003F9C6FDC
SAVQPALASAGTQSRAHSAEQTGVAVTPIESAKRRASEVGDRAAGLAAGLERSADAYGALEAYSSRLQEVAGGWLGWLAGFFSTILAGFAVSGWGIALAVDASLAWFAVVGVRRMMGLDTRLDPAGLLAEHPRFVNNPVTAAASSREETRTRTAATVTG